MDRDLDREPSPQELRERMREVLSAIRRSIGEPEEPPLSGRSPRRTLPLVEEQSRRAR